jgi:hypothetical protein
MKWCGAAARVEQFDGAATPAKRKGRRRDTL